MCSADYQTAFATTNITGADHGKFVDSLRLPLGYSMGTSVLTSGGMPRMWYIVGDL